MPKTCKVSFKPDNVSVEVPESTTILAAANKAGVFIDSLCGGDGVCGRCRVIVLEGSVAGGSTDCFTHEEIPSGKSRGLRTKPEELQAMLDEYYERRGWDADGVPTRRERGASPQREANA